MAEHWSERARRQGGWTWASWWGTHWRLVGGLLVAPSMALLAFVALSACTGGVGLPLDDSWIHCAFARNLARNHVLSLNPPEPSPGLTSLLWTCLLAVPRLVGVPPPVTAVLLGALAHLVLVALVFRIGQNAFSIYPGTDWYAGAAALAFGLGGNAVWHALSGMETWLFLALGVAACLAYSATAWYPAGLLAAGTVLVRPEGCLLLVALAVDAALRRRRGHHRDAPRAEALLKLLVPGVLAFALLCLANTGLTGQPFPTTLGGKRWLAGLDSELDFTGQAVLWHNVQRLILSWADQIVRWVLGGEFVAQVGLGHLGAITLHNRQIGALVLLWAVPAGVLAVVGLGNIAYRWWRPGPTYRRPPPDPVRPLLLWLVLQFACYAVLLPWGGHGGRYQPMVYPVLVLLIGLGWASLAHPPTPLAPGPEGRRAVRRAAWVAGPLIGGQIVVALGLWACAYTGNVRQINEVQVASARWVAQAAPPAATVAAFDIGAMAYYANHRIVDLGGLTDLDYLAFLRYGRVVDYMRGEQAALLALPEMPSQVEGSIADRLGLLEPSAWSQAAVLPVRTFRADDPACSLGLAATVNAYPQITLYRLDWNPGYEPPLRRQPPETGEAPNADYHSMFGPSVPSSAYR